MEAFVKHGGFREAETDAIEAETDAMFSYAALASSAEL
jgi:hypothetical protein